MRITSIFGISASRAALAAALVAALAGCSPNPSHGQQPSSDPDHGLTKTQRVGKRLFNDTNLSEPHVMSCATCHNPDRAFAGNNGSGVGVPLSSTGTLGLRNTPSIMYGSFAPTFSVVPSDDGPTPTGGQFLDGRVQTQADQAKVPLLSPSEMNNPSAAAVVAKVAVATYAADFRALFGDDIFSRPDDAFDAIANAIEAYEHSAEFHPFSSRFDEYLRGHDTFTPAERHGLSLYFDPQKGNCVACHVADVTNHDPAGSMFTDFTYDNLGVPRNLNIPSNSLSTFFDLGLGGPKRTDLPDNDPSFNGAFKVPTLRNVAVKEAFMHNGYFNHLSDVVSFYVTRDTDPAHWYLSGTKFEDLPAQFRGNVNTVEVPYDRHPGDAPHLNPQEVGDLVAFLRTLTDQEFVPMLPISN